MEITMVPINQIQPYWRNPRKNHEAIAKVRESLKEFGWRQPIVVDTENVIIAGDTRWRAARSLKQTQVPVHVAKDLNEAQVRAYRLADNRIHDIAEWDEELLKEELSELEQEGFDLEVMGFSEKELSKALATEDLNKPEKVDDTQPQLGDLSYSVVVRCNGEEHQKKLLKRFKTEGLPCEALIS